MKGDGFLLADVVNLQDVDEAEMNVKLFDDDVKEDDERADDKVEMIENDVVDVNVVVNHDVDE